MAPPAGADTAAAAASAPAPVGAASGAAATPGPTAVAPNGAPQPSPAGPASGPTAHVAPPAPGSGATTATETPPPTMQMPASRWVAADWRDLPGWREDYTIFAWPALLRSCERPAAGWAATCAQARALSPVDESRVREFLVQHLQPWRIEAPDGRRDGMITGYYEPVIEATRELRGPFRVPLYAPPPDLAAGRPWFTRSQIDQESLARSALRGRELAHVADPLDALVLQIQGSGRLWLTEPDGQRHLVRAAFAGHNNHPYRSVGRWLVERGAFTVEQASWPAIKAWARANPARVPEMLAANPRYVFFREEPLPDPTIGPLGAQGVPLTPGRSIAVDRESVPYGTPVWIDTTEPWAPLPGLPRPLQRLVVAQDTGSAIVGAVRADYFWGWGDGADELAGRMKQPLRMWALWPRS